MTTVSSAFLGHSFGHLHLSWRNPSSSFYPVRVLSPLSNVCSNVSSLIRSLLSSAVLALPLSPRPTPMSDSLPDNDYEGKEQSALRVTGRGIARLINCHPSLPLECDSMEEETFIFSFNAVSTYDSAWHIKTVLLLLLLFLTSCSGIHSALLLYKTVQYMGFSYFITGWTQSRAVTYTAFGFRQLFC